MVLLRSHTDRPLYGLPSVRPFVRFSVRPGTRTAQIQGIALNISVHVETIALVQVVFISVGQM